MFFAFFYPMIGLLFLLLHMLIPIFFIIVIFFIVRWFFRRWK